MPHMAGTTERVACLVAGVLLHHHLHEEKNRMGWGFLITGSNDSCPCLHVKLSVRIKSTGVA